MDIIQLNPLFKFDSSGALITSAEGTPTAGDASAYNQLQQILIATNANIATITSLSSINSNIQSSNTATNEKLGLINTAIDSGNQLISDINDKITIHSGYAKYLTPPRAELLASANIENFRNTTNKAVHNDVNDKIRAEKTDYYDIGIAYKANKNLTLAVDSYYKNIDNLFL
jgi:hypothetical protein